MLLLAILASSMTIASAMDTDTTKVWRLLLPLVSGKTIKDQLSIIIIYITLKIFDQVKKSPRLRYINH